VVRVGGNLRTLLPTVPRVTGQIAEAVARPAPESVLSAGEIETWKSITSMATKKTPILRTLLGHAEVAT
jgi:hypothetical protein